MDADPRVLAVCVNFNGGTVLLETLRSLTQSTYSRLRILVVDNASNDFSPTLLPPEIGCLRLTENRGYGGAINAAVEPALRDESYDLFFILNNDLQFEPETLETLVSLLPSDGPAVVGPQVRQLANPQRLDAAWGRVSWNHVLATFEGKNAPGDQQPWNQARRVELLLGCALLVSAQTFHRTGLFDESFFMYHEEVDFLYRCKKQGVPVFYQPSARVYHHGGFTTRKTPLKRVYWVRRNAVLFLKKHDPGWPGWVRFWTTLTASLLFNLVRFRWSKIQAIMAGVRAGFQEAR